MTDMGKVAVLAGGRSAEREVSLRSGNAVLQALKEQGVQAAFFDPAEHNLLELAQQGYQRAFIALHGGEGENGQVQAVLQALNVPYTGSGVLACALAMDKARTKYLWQGMGLPTAPSEVVHREQAADVDYHDMLARLGGKVMVKPCQEGSSVGMAQADNAQTLAEAVQQAARYDDSVLVEAWLPGEEYTVGVLGDQALPTIKVRTPHTFYDYAAKYEDNTTEYICPAGLSDGVEQALRNLTLRAFAAVGGRGWGRVDFKQDANGHMQLLEVNTVPGMTAKSLVPMAAKQHGLSFGQLVMRILADARL